jgi:hypothetical protein
MPFFLFHIIMDRKIDGLKPSKHSHFILVQSIRERENIIPIFFASCLYINMWKYN